MLLKALVIEDNQDSAELMRRSLDAFGFEVVVYHAGRAAVADVAQLRPEVIVVDISLPDINGMALLAYFQQYVPLSTIVVCSGWSKFQVQRVVQSQVNYIEKPIDVTAFGAQVKAFLPQLREA